MDITKFVVSSREKALLYGDYSTYRSQLGQKLLSIRRRLGIATKHKAKFHPHGDVAPAQLAENHDWLYLCLLQAERSWAFAMAMKANHSADAKGITSKTRSHIVSRLNKAARTAETLAEVISHAAPSGASSVDVLEARAYAALLRGAADFERRIWQPCLRSYAVARMIYSALSTSAQGDTFKDLLSDTIDPSIRYAAYQVKIPRTQPVATIARTAFPADDADLSRRIAELGPNAPRHGEQDVKQAPSAGGGDGAPKSMVWRTREVKIEDASIAVAWASASAAKAQLREKLASLEASSKSTPKAMAMAYDGVLIASQDAADATKQAIEELRSEGVTESDPRMQSLLVTRTAVNYEMISWRIGRNRALTGPRDGATMEFGPGKGKKKKTAVEEQADRPGNEEAPGRIVARLKDKVVLYNGTLQSVESMTELPGVANDQDLSAALAATTQYFTALKCLALARSHQLAGNVTNALALAKHALDQCEASAPALSSAPQQQQSQQPSSPQNIVVTTQDVDSLRRLLEAEFQRLRALVEISALQQQQAAVSGASSSSLSSPPLISRLSEYPIGGVDLENVVAFPPRVEPVPVKPLFLDVAWNYIHYPSKQQQQQQRRRPSGAADQTAAGQDGKPQKKGWFGFGR